MNPTQHSSNNRVLGAPPGWDQQTTPVSALAVTDTRFNGTPGVASFWRPSAEELAALNAGGLVMLNVIGTTMPPVCLGVALAEGAEP